MNGSLGCGMDEGTKIRTIIIIFYCAADTTERKHNNITINTFILGDPIDKPRDADKKDDDSGN